jgi:hypothetical protein
MTGRHREVQPRRFIIDGLVHLYLRREFTQPYEDLVTPLHADATLHPDDHERRKVGEPIVDLTDVQLCEPCAEVARLRAQASEETPVIPSARPRANAPGRDDLATLAGADNCRPTAPAGVTRS